LDKVEYSNYLGDANVHLKLNSGLPRQKAALNQKTSHFTGKLDLHLMKKLAKYYILSIGFYSVET
jgi:hypothetical protein